MRWFSRWYRNTAIPRLAITVTDHADGNHETSAKVWQEAFSQLDSRRLPASWAAVDGQQAWPMGEQLLGSDVPHEMAYSDVGAETCRRVPEFRQQAEIAKRVQVPLRTMVSAAGVHPSMLAQLGVEAFVPTQPPQPSPTGSLRAVAWKTWEAPLTDRLSVRLSRSSCDVLKQRLASVVATSRRMHLLWQLPSEASSSISRPLMEFLDCIADYQRRGWLRTETVGQAAAEYTQRATIASAA